MNANHLFERSYDFTGANGPRQVKGINQYSASSFGAGTYGEFETRDQELLFLHADSGRKRFRLQALRQPRFGANPEKAVTSGHL